MTRAFPNWRELYREQAVEKMPWYYAALDPDLERALAAHPLVGGRALDLGTGPATQAFALARRGFEVTGSDLSAHAIELARARAAEQGVAVDFVQDDILNTKLQGSFDLILDRGCYHVFEPELRSRYARTVTTLIKPLGLLFLKCFSEEQPGDVGPYQSSPAQIEATFSESFDVLTIERTIYQGTLEQPPRALFCTLQRR
jgi:2-polyprenyl-3-methyl-5-hydroxy-6-metoxy-1,4-benzoquinol methylase